MNPAPSEPELLERSRRDDLRHHVLAEAPHTLVQALLNARPQSHQDELLIGLHLDLRHVAVRVDARHGIVELYDSQSTGSFTVGKDPDNALVVQDRWPGNVRELRNVECRALLVRQGPKIDAKDIAFDESSQPTPEDAASPGLELPEDVTLEQMMQRLERQLVESTLRRCHYTKDRAAKLLGMDRSSLFERLMKWGIKPEEA